MARDGKAGCCRERGRDGDQGTTGFLGNKAEGGGLRCYSGDMSPVDWDGDGDEIALVGTEFVSGLIIIERRAD